jgi:transposase-like protein
MPEKRCSMARIRRTFTPEFKRDAVRLVVKEGKTVSEVARNLGLARSLLQRWVEQHADQDREGNPRKARGAEGILPPRSDIYMIALPGEEYLQHIGDIEVVFNY